MILVTGATGNVGRHVVSQLLDAGAAVRALTRDPASARLPGGAEVVRGDLGDPGSLDAALEGVASVFLVWPTLSADRAAPAVVEAIAKRAGHVVYVSANGTSADQEGVPGSILGSHAFLERLIEESGARWTLLRPSGFATNTLLWAPRIRATGVVRGAHGKAARSLIHERDIAAVGVRALTEDGHAGLRYVLTGPETVTMAEQVTLIGEAVGRPARWEELTRREAHREMVAEGWPASTAEEVLDAHAAMAASPEPVTSTVRDVLGRPAATFRQWAVDHAADFR
ncbi:NAD(P)H-binding protein [Sphaerisporangium sp. TRM90804]|uniref:NAD(P)H-binding protein n=1 Tax=Sphaerisporangium sp. TRM90804 TaxID=3031113 RepID=UPI00244A76B6|nr:NAD(P)H-binding protein [Sphaerisporangium sp. TRM90804]MDH2427484.1 NAD(P)H-binding protein [Sphaerisporangium sp. TRM90804]